MAQAWTLWLKAWEFYGSARAHIGSGLDSMAKGLRIIVRREPISARAWSYGQRPGDDCSVRVDIGSGLDSMAKGLRIIVRREPISARVQTLWPKVGR